MFVMSIMASTHRRFPARQILEFAIGIASRELRSVRSRPRLWSRFGIVTLGKFALYILNPFTAACRTRA
jgi:hypothetical protein